MASKRSAACLGFSEAHLDPSEQEQAFDSLFFAVRARLFKKSERVAEAGRLRGAAGPPACPKSRTEPVAHARRRRKGSPPRKRGRAAYCFLPPNQPCITVSSASRVAENTPPVSSAPGPKNAPRISPVSPRDEFASAAEVVSTPASVAVNPLSLAMRPFETFTRPLMEEWFATP